MTAVIEVEDLGKVYPDGAEALRGISFSVDEGEFFGFLGPNGAGKSTTIKILITLLRSTSGTARVFGRDVTADPNLTCVLIGYAAQVPQLFTNSAQLPIALLPDWMRTVARSNPVTYAINAMRVLLNGPAAANDDNAGVTVLRAS